jgi:hypothetical protein
MNIAFTICSNNYLAQAKVLQKSFINHNSDYKFIIGLVDKLDPSINYENEFENAVIVIDEKIVKGYEGLVAKFDIIELNTAVKPFFIQYLIKKFSPSFVHYLDPDIKVYGSLSVLDEEMNGKSLLLTPHFYTPVPDDGLTPFENLALNHGIYNLGYLGVNAKHSETAPFLDWWSLRTSNHGFSRVCNGFFVDQLWINLVPIFFKDVCISNHFGSNIGPWNLHERSLSADGKSVLMKNERVPLLFYHFSSYSYTKPDLLSRHYNRYSLSDRPDLIKLYGDYLSDLKNNNCVFYSQLDCLVDVIKPPKKTMKSDLKRMISRRVNKVWDKI